VATGEPLGSDDYESAQRASDELTRRGWRRYSLNDALGAWEHVVESVESGYSMTIDDYTNDLSIRQWSEEARVFITRRVAAWMDERLAIADARFRDATTEASRRCPPWATDGEYDASRRCSSASWPTTSPETASGSG
jgi:hypothetical protein